MGAQRLIFGIGAAKSGTSWLWEYLYHHGQTSIRAVKELHYFDVLERGGKTWAQDVLRREVDEAKALAAAGSIRPFRAKRLIDGQEWLKRFDGKTRDDAAYLDFLGLGQGAARVVGDFTPSYGLLREETYAQMANMAEDVRFVFLIRDPVARLWSNVRMDAGAGADAATLDRLLTEVMETPGHEIALRSNYRRTLNRLLSVVPAERVHIEFYERLFTPEAIARLCAFLGIDPEPADFGKVVWGGTPAVLPAGRIGQMAAFLQPQYNFIEKMMGDLPAEWAEARVAA